MDGASFLSTLKKAATMRSAPDDWMAGLLARKPTWPGALPLAKAADSDSESALTAHPSSPTAPPTPMSSTTKGTTSSMPQSHSRSHAAAPSPRGTASHLAAPDSPRGTGPSSACRSAAPAGGSADSVAVVGGSGANRKRPRVRPSLDVGATNSSGSEVIVLDDENADEREGEGATPCSKRRLPPPSAPATPRRKALVPTLSRAAVSTLSTPASASEARVEMPSTEQAPASPETKGAKRRRPGPKMEPGQGVSGARDAGAENAKKEKTAPSVSQCPGSSPARVNQEGSTSAPATPVASLPGQLAREVAKGASRGEPGVQRKVVQEAQASHKSGTSARSDRTVNSNGPPRNMGHTRREEGAHEIKPREQSTSQGQGKGYKQLLQQVQQTAGLEVDPSAQPLLQAVTQELQKMPEDQLLGLLASLLHQRGLPTSGLTGASMGTPSVPQPGSEAPWDQRTEAAYVQQWEAPRAKQFEERQDHGGQERDLSRLASVPPLFRSQSETASSSGRADPPASGANDSNQGTKEAAPPQGPSGVPAARFLEQFDNNVSERATRTAMSRSPEPSEGHGTRTPSPGPCPALPSSPSSSASEGTPGSPQSPEGERNILEQLWGPEKNSTRDIASQLAADSPCAKGHSCLEPPPLAMSPPLGGTPGTCQDEGQDKEQLFGPLEGLFTSEWDELWGQGSFSAHLEALACSIVD